jgi:hypothetical protein
VHVSAQGQYGTGAAVLRDDWHGVAKQVLCLCPGEVDDVSLWVLHPGRLRWDEGWVPFDQAQQELAHPEDAPEGNAHGSKDCAVKEQVCECVIECSQVVDSGGWLLGLPR